MADLDGTEADLYMQISPSEIQEIVMGLSGKPDKLYAEGLHVAGERYVLTKAEDRSLYARKAGPPFTDLKPKRSKQTCNFEPSPRANLKDTQLTLGI